MRAILLGFDCNNRCGFCAQGALRERIAERSVDELRGEVIQHAKAGEMVAFVGGEPTLSPHLCDLVRLARSTGASGVLVQTNARRFAAGDDLAQLVDAGLSSLDVSLVGSTAVMHDFHTGVEGSFAETIAGLREAKRRSVPVGITIVITRSNFRNLAEMARLARDVGARAIHLSLARPLGNARSAAPPLVPLRELVEPYVVSVVKAAHADGLGVVFDGKSTDRRWPSFFAGIGVTDS